MLHLLQLRVGGRRVLYIWYREVPVKGPLLHAEGTQSQPQLTVRGDPL
jgi:hypothetical protein